MSDFRDKMRRRMAGASNEGESIRNNAFEFANKNFENSPSYRRATVASFQNPELTEIDIRVMNVERMGDIREILFRPYQGVDVGSYLTFDNETWLVYDRYGSIEGGKVKVMAERCTEKLRWKDKTDLYHEQFCVASATQLGSKANQGKNALEWNKFDVRLPLGQIFVFIEKNTVTQHLVMSQRFILGSNAYEILGIDDVTSTNVDGFGFIQITMGLTTKRDEDDFVNRLAFNRYDVPIEDGTASIMAQDEEDEKGGRIW